MSVSVIISTYNSPEWLKKVLWGYECQQYSDFEVLVADDGSGEETRRMLQEFVERSSLRIRHIWHPDNGFQKCTILNKAIHASDSEYLIFTDGDCVPREDFVETHVRLKEQNKFLSGGAIRLPLSLSQQITRKDVSSQLAFDYDWLRQGGMESNHKTRKIKYHGRLARFLNFLTPTNASWNGGNASAYRKDIVAVNGYDQRMEWGGEDRELGSRLENYGLKGKQVRFLAHCVHLDHGRPYKDKDKVAFNDELRRKTEKDCLTWTDFGITSNKV